MANEVGHHAKLSELEKNMQCPPHKLEILARGKGETKGDGNQKSNQRKRKLNVEENPDSKN